jgi:PPOX class probable F420-dependent enzyme
MIDFNTKFGQRVQKRLEHESVIWLTTVDSKGNPQPRPVWFHWDGETVLIFSQVNGAKVRHIKGNPRVAVNLNSTPDGGDVMVLLGEATIVEGKVSPERLIDYIRKYREGIKNIGLTPASFEADYHVTILVRPTSLRGF